MEIINKEFADSSEALYNLGAAYLNKKEYLKAKELLINSNATKGSIYTQYLIILCDVLPIIERRGALLVLSETEKSILLNAYNKLSSKEIQQFFDKAIAEVREEYWHRRVSILLFVDINKAAEEYKLIPEQFLDNPDYKLLYADILLLNGQKDEAVNILDELYKEFSNKDILSKILNVYINTNETDKILLLYKSLEEKDYDEEGKISSTIFDTLSEELSFNEVVKESEKLLKTSSNPFFLYQSIGLFYFKNQMPELAKEFFDKIDSSIKIENYPPRYSIAESIFKSGFPEIALDVLKPLVLYNDNAKIRYIQMLISVGTEEKYIKANELLEQEVRKNESSLAWRKLKVDLNYNWGKKFTALEDLMGIYELEPTPNNAYNVVVLKTELGDTTGFLKYGQTLERGERNPIYTIIAAVCYEFEGNHEFAQSLSYKALSLNNDSFNEVIYQNYLRINFFSGTKKDLKEKVELDEIEVDSAFELVNAEQSIWVAIESDNSLFSNKQELSFIGATHYKEDDLEIMHLIGTTKNSTVKYKGQNFVVMDIITKNARAIRFCLEEYTSKKPDSPFIKKVQVDENDPLKSILPMLVKMEDSKNKLLEDYNLKNEIGLPLWIIGKNFGQSLFDGIMYLLGKNNQLFYSGEVILISRQDIPKILSPSSIIILQISDLLQNLKDDKEFIFLPESTLDYFRDELEKVNKWDSRIEMSIGMEDSRPFITNLSKETLRNRREFYVNILNSLKEFKIEKMQIPESELDENASTIKLISIQDFAGIKLADKMRGIYICDDLVIRKVSKIVFKKNLTTNLVGYLFIHYKDNIEDLLDILIKLAQSNYLYVYNNSLLLQIVDRVISQYKIIGSDTLYDKFSKLISASLSPASAFDSYEPILFNVIQNIYYRGLDKYIDYVIKTILKNIWLHYSLYNIDENILHTKIQSISKTKDDYKNFVSILDELKKANYN